MSNVTGFADLAKKQPNARKTGYTPDELRRQVLKEQSAALLALSDSKIVSDAELMRLMQTRFGQSIGPYMRALFPPQVNCGNPVDVPPAYREALTAAEEAVAVAEAGDAAFPAPPHDCRDMFVRCGDLFATETYGLDLPQIGRGNDGYHKHWFQNSGPYFGEGSYFNEEEQKRAFFDERRAYSSRPSQPSREEAGKDQDSKFWSDEFMTYMSQLASQLSAQSDVSSGGRARFGGYNSDFDQPQNTYSDGL